MKPPESQKKSLPDSKSRDWVTIGLVLGILYLVLLLPFVALIGGNPAVLGGAIGALTTALVGIITIRAVKG